MLQSITKIFILGGVLFFFSFHLCSGFSFPNYSMIHHLRWLIFFSLATYLSMVSMGVIKSKKERERVRVKIIQFSAAHLPTCPLLCGHYDYYIWDFALVFFLFFLLFVISLALYMMITIGITRWWWWWWYPGSLMISFAFSPCSPSLSASLPCLNKYV